MKQVDDSRQEQKIHHDLIYNTDQSQQNYNLMFLIYLLIFYTTTAHNVTDKVILQQILNGVYQQSRLPHPKTIVECFENVTARDWAVTVEHSIGRAAYGQPIDYYNLIKIIRYVATKTPFPVFLCLYGNPEIISIGQRFDLYNFNDLKQLEQKLIRELALNYDEVRKEVIVLNHEFKQHKFYRVGFQASAYVHKLLHEISLRSKITDKQILQDLLSGVYRSNSLNGPVTVVGCFDDLSALKAVQKIRGLISQIANSKGSDFNTIKAIIAVQHFWSQLSSLVKNCLNKNFEFLQFADKYGVQKRGRLSLTTEAITYFKFNAVKAKKLFQHFEVLWKVNNYEKIGFQLAEEERKIFKQYKMGNN